VRGRKWGAPFNPAGTRDGLSTDRAVHPSSGNNLSELPGTPSALNTRGGRVAARCRMKGTSGRLYDPPARMRFPPAQRAGRRRMASVAVYSSRTIGRRNWGRLWLRGPPGAEPSAISAIPFFPLAAAAGSPDTPPGPGGANQEPGWPWVGLAGTALLGFRRGRPPDRRAPAKSKGRGRSSVW